MRRALGGLMLLLLLLAACDGQLPGLAGSAVAPTQAVATIALTSAPATPTPVSYTHLTLPTSDLV